MKAPRILPSVEFRPRLPLYQYWDSGSPPEEVAGLISTWKDDPAYDHRFHDERTAEALIRKVAGQRAARAFRECGNGALQSDVFRLSVLRGLGGLYVDADIPNLGGLDRHLLAVQAGYLRVVVIESREVINTDVLYARHPESSLIAFCHKMMMHRVETRFSNNVADVAGPGLFNEAWRRKKRRRELFDGWMIESLMGSWRFAPMKLDLDYKATSADWRVALETGKSIFRDADAIETHWVAQGTGSETDAVSPQEGSR